MHPFLLGGGKMMILLTRFVVIPSWKVCGSHGRDSFVQQASFWPPEQPCISYPSCLDKKELRLTQYTYSI